MGSMRATLQVIPGRATGLLYFVLRWPGGQFSGQHAGSITGAIRLFTQRLRKVPPGEMESASGHLDAALRKAGGGIKHVRLATWTGSQPLERFFESARTAWRRLPKEHDDFAQPQSMSLRDAATSGAGKRA
jgi:hypothetical protein